MPEAILQRKMQRVVNRSDYYASQTNTWTLEDTQAALELHDFQDFLEGGVQWWGYLCEYYDYLQEHDMECEHNHDEFYRTAFEEFAKFRSIAAEIVTDILPKFEAEFQVDHANEFRQALSESVALTNFDKKKFKATSTPVTDWQ